VQVLHLSPTHDAGSNRNGLKCDESYSDRQVAQDFKSGRKSSSIIGFFTHFLPYHFWVIFTHLRYGKLWVMFCGLGNDFLGIRKAEEGLRLLNVKGRAIADPAFDV
jgi:hypothetical protein